MSKPFISLSAPVRRDVIASSLYFNTGSAAPGPSHEPWSEVWEAVLHTPERPTAKLRCSRDMGGFLRIWSITENSQKVELNTQSRVN